MELTRGCPPPILELPVSRILSASAEVAELSSFVPCYYCLLPTVGLPEGRYPRHPYRAAFAPSCLVDVTCDGASVLFTVFIPVFYVSTQVRADSQESMVSFLFTVKLRTVGRESSVSRQSSDQLHDDVRLNDK